MITADSVYSTTGAVAPLAGLADVAQPADRCWWWTNHTRSARTDRAARFGRARTGRAGAFPYRLAGQAFGGRAGFIACSPQFKTSSRSRRGRPSSAPACCGTEIAGSKPPPTSSPPPTSGAPAYAITRSTRDAIAALGYNISDGSEQIIGLEAGSEPRSCGCATRCRPAVFSARSSALPQPPESGIDAPYLHAKLTAAEIERLLGVLAEIRDEVRLDQWSSTRRARRAVPGMRHAAGTIARCLTARAAVPAPARGHAVMRSCGHAAEPRSS